jgi:type II secretory pathway pseudopilin PulG
VKNRFAFTMIELIFVIMIMGILGKYGVEFLSQAYNNFIFSKINNTLQSDSQSAIEVIASRLQFRIKDSIIARVPESTHTHFKALADSDYNETATVLEWVGMDIEGFRGDLNTTPILPTWSSIIDINESQYNLLKTPETNTSAINNLIDVLSDGDSNISNAAIYFVGSNTNIKEWGWGGVALADQNKSIHRIDAGVNIDEFVPKVADFNGTDVYEYYQFAWTAYAVEHDTTSGDLFLHYDYQPWEGDKYNDSATKKALIMKNVSTFRFKAVGSVVKIQVCTKSNVMENYSICKEKTIF